MNWRCGGGGSTLAQIGPSERTTGFLLRAWKSPPTWPELASKTAKQVTNAVP